jgi:hypothetical protein
MVGMRTKQHSTMRDIVSACTRLYSLESANCFRADDASDLKGLRDSVGQIWSFLAQGAAASLPPAVDANADSDLPGFVVFRNGPFRVLVPFFLADVFPHGAILSQVCKMGEQLQIGTDSEICVSGSTCYLGSGLPVADLDFCEYIPRGDQTIPDRLLNKLAATAPICYRLKLGKLTWTRPWPGALVGQPRPYATLSEALTKDGFKQCIFVVELPEIGVAEATNILILLDYANTELGEASRSFAAQEAPFTRIERDWTPRDLSSPLALGAYFDRMVRAAGDLCLDSASEPRLAVKAVRRTLSLTKLLADRRKKQQLLSLLQSCDGGRLAALFDRCALYATISDSGDSTLRQLIAPLEASIDRLRAASTGDPADYRGLTHEEEQGLRTFRDQAVPQVVDILRDLNDLLYSGSA